MERESGESDIFYQTIRKELSSIITDSSDSSKHDDLTKTVYTKSKHTKKRSFDHQSTDKITNLSQEHSKTNVVTDATLDINKKETLEKNEGRHDIDADIRKMQANLRQSYELFQTVGDKFETISFSGLKNRIKDLHLSSNSTNNQQRAAINRDLRGMLEKNYLENSLDKLTSEMSNKFRAHPGEFGDIPEISAFFQACSQLEHGLDELKKQQNDINEVGKRVSQAIDMANDRIVEIKQTMDECKPDEED